YDLMPEMSAHGITDAICADIAMNAPDFICLDFANPDMVGHSGVFDAVVNAVETVDSCTQGVVETGLLHGYSFIVLADHGNSEYMLNDDGSVNTAHPTKLVPCILSRGYFLVIQDGKLGDEAPTTLRMMAREIRSEMT